MLGADYFFEIVTGEIRKGSAGPVAISSKLGWLISGPVDVAPKDANIYSNFVSSCSIVDQHLVNEITKSDADKFLQEQRVVDNEKELIVVVVVVYFILSRLLYLAFSANLGLLCMPHPGMGPLV